MFFRPKMKQFTGSSFADDLARLKARLEQAEAVVIGAGAGLSTAAGFTYAGERFERYFSDFAEKYHFADMYSGGFYPYKTLEEHWAYWSRNIYINRYMDAPKPVYDDLLRLVKNKDYFVLTTNVDHCFQKAGFDKQRLFYTQGDYGLFQCSEPCCQQTWDNAETVRMMVRAQGFRIAEDGTLEPPEQSPLLTEIPTELIPRCPNCGKPMGMNLRADDTFVQDQGWEQAAERFDDFIRSHQSRNIVYLEIGVGFNTPGIIKYNFWNLTNKNPNALYACLNKGEADAPKEIQNRSVCISGDSAQVISKLLP